MCTTDKQRRQSDNVQDGPGDVDGKSISNKNTHTAEYGAKSTEQPTNRGKSRLRIAIVGGGIGGLAIALMLNSHGAVSPDNLKVDIYERAPSFTELGAGVGVWLRTWRILSSISISPPSSDEDNSAALAYDLARMTPPGRDMTDKPREAFEFRKSDVEPEGCSFYTMVVPFGVLTLHRADFQQVIAKHTIPPVTPHFCKKLVNYEYVSETGSVGQSDRSTDANPCNDNTMTGGELLLRFEDGTTARADLLIGADGIRSVVRKQMLSKLANRGLLDDVLVSNCVFPVAEGTSRKQTQESAKPVAHGICETELEKTQARGKPNVDPVDDLAEPVWSGTNVYRYLIPLDKLEKRFPNHRASKRPVVYFGKSKHIVAFPLVHVSPDGFTVPMVNLVAFVSTPELENSRISEKWVRPGSSEKLISAFEGWEDEVKALLDVVENPLLWAIHAVKPLPCYSDVDENVVLLGDAAHAMTPHQGAGGGQAIEDAYVLAALLADPRTNKTTLAAALRAYDAVRVPESQRVQKVSRLNGMAYEFNYAWDLDGNGKSTEQSVDDEGSSAGKKADEELELSRLKALAVEIMKIQCWEWEDSDGDHTGIQQAARAIRLFERMLNA